MAHLVLHVPLSDGKDYQVQIDVLYAKAKDAGFVMPSFYQNKMGNAQNSGKAIAISNWISSMAKGK